MRAGNLLRRLPCLVCLVLGCGDELAGLGGSGTGPSPGSSSGVGSTTGAMTSNADDSTTDGVGRTSYLDATGDPGTTGNSDATGSSNATGSSGNSHTTGQPGTTGNSESTGDPEINHAPTAVDDVASTEQGAVLVLGGTTGLLANDSDPDGDPLTVTAFDPVSTAGGTVLVTAHGTVQYQPPFGFRGVDTFEYTIEDDAGAAATARVTVYVGLGHVPLADITAGIGGFILNGEAQNDLAGNSVSGAGDVNGDGLDDVIVGAHRADSNGDRSGRSYVVFGKADTSPVDLSAIVAGVGGFVLGGEDVNHISGYSVSGAGDVNADGMDDIIIGAPGQTAELGGPAPANGNDSGLAYVVFGKADTAAVELSAIRAGVGGFVLEGEAALDQAGHCVSGARDVNGDGMDDIILGAGDADPNGDASGRSYVVFGKADTAPVNLGAITAGLGGFVLNGEAAGDFSGRSVSDAGDVNDDGMDDIIIGAFRAAPNGTASGRSYVVFGRADTAPVELAAITAGLGGFVLHGEAEEDESGRSVSAAGDINADGLDDIIIGANRADPNGETSGRSYVVFGKSDTAAVELSSITAGIGGFALDGEAGYDQSGRSVSGAGDVNGDGTDDIIIGAGRSDPNGFSSGRSYVVYGKSDTAAVELSSIIAGIAGFVLDGEASYNFSGHSVSGAGDINADGIADIIIGAPGNDANGDTSGRSYVVFGVPVGNN